LYSKIRILEKLRKQIKDYKGGCQGRALDRYKVQYDARERLNTMYQGKE
jgi:uncharacterized protein YukE